jgi:arylformamidase
MSNWKYLSHQLSPNHFAYGNGKTIKIEQINSIRNGDSSNNTLLKIPTHFGTHLDFPYHFDENGKKGNEYPPDYFISNKVQIINIDISPIENHLINKEDFTTINFKPNTEILIIKTGMGFLLEDDKYWSANPGFSPDLADYFKQRMSNLRILGFDSISLTGRKYRDEGKAAHVNFLLANDILILEDMDLSILTPETNVEEIIISPLCFDGMDGAPVTVFAKINE